MAARAARRLAAWRSSISSMRTTVVVLPVPGPPVSTKKRAPGTAATAARCQSVAPAGMPANSASRSSASTSAEIGRRAIARSVAGSRRRALPHAASCATGRSAVCASSTNGRERASRRRPRRAGAVRPALRRRSRRRPAGRPVVRRNGHGPPRCWPRVRPRRAGPSRCAACTHCARRLVDRALVGVAWRGSGAIHAAASCTPAKASSSASIKAAGQRWRQTPRPGARPSARTNRYQLSPRWRSAV